MPRSNRRRRDDPGDASLDRLISGWRRIEVRRGRDWSVQPMAAGRSEKTYTCPGCGAPIEAGAAHVVVWREDGVLGPQADLAARRHWHAHCWNLA
ncbi:hypothetical protein N8K70_09165 [Microbacterium betulae]|uniref:ATP/GTP-binding protein n=1 Tax=Microbacterium betulae TaxID=2981139 RepID=A0AA97FDH8_9MICO|nr:hypothetical protein [Microbacterium sp. AB]WOF21566.1 hypothetical protein N8K70_09165 [Microbacterium sp. AB]